MRSIRTPGIAIAAAFALASVLSAATYTVTNTADSGAGSLRQAVTDANGTPGVADTIAFNIPGGGVQTITPLTDLPSITDDLTIDGYTQPGSSPNTGTIGQPDDSVHLIEIDGTHTFGGNGGFVLGFSGAIDFTVRGLVINRAPAAAINVVGASGVVEGCFLGVDPAGTASLPNGYGVAVESSPGLRIGGTLPAQRNVISTNDSAQIAFGCLFAGGTDHIIQGNFIGTDSTGASLPVPVPVLNNDGIALCHTVSNVTIGGNGAARNVISGNNFIGIDISSGLGSPDVTNNVVQGNFIGTDRTGTVALPNGSIGVRDNSPGNSILHNVISGNGGDGVQVNGNDAVIQENFIGTDFSGLQPLGNAGWGIRLLASGAVIGGTGATEANVIAYNGSSAPSIGGVFIENGTGSPIRANSIHDNNGLGIDISPLGATPNDEGDDDTGPNNLQNYPVLATVTPLAVPTGGSRVQGVLHSAASTIYTVDFFSNDACVRFPKDFVEGRTYLGSDTVTTDAFGEGPIDTTLPTSIAPGERISMTATDPAGNTSEFSQRLPFSIAPASGPPAGGTAVSIAGTDFEGPATVTVGGQPATDVVVADFNHVTATTPALAPGVAYDVTVTIPEGVTGTLEKGWVADFVDVPPINQFYSFVTTLVSNAITAGIGNGLYGVDESTLRQQMAVFLLKGKHGLCYTPPPCVGTFPDVPCPSTFANWIEALAAEGITGGCGGGNYCPQNPVRRDQMAVFLLKAEHGSSYLPPACNGDFPDVPCPSLFADWIEQLAAESITGGCGGGNYCPADNNTRGQMAVFITKTFKLP